MGVLPECLRCRSADGRKGLPGQATVAVDLLKKELGARNGRFRDSEIATSDDALYALCLRQERRVRDGGRGELKELGVGELRNAGVKEI